jgi:hypothetical protein
VRAETVCGPTALFLLFALFFAATFAGQRFSLFLAWLQVIGVTLHFFNEVFLLYLGLPAKSVFERLAFLQPNCELNDTPRLILNELVLYCNLAP